MRPIRSISRNNPRMIADDLSGARRFNCRSTSASLSRICCNSELKTSRSSNSAANDATPNSICVYRTCANDSALSRAEPGSSCAFSAQWSRAFDNHSKTCCQLLAARFITLVFPLSLRIATVGQGMRQRPAAAKLAATNTAMTTLIAPATRSALPLGNAAVSALTSVTHAARSAGAELSCPSTTLSGDRSCIATRVLAASK